MSRCAYCGTTTLFGAKRHGELRFCSNTCAAHGPVMLLAERVPDALVRDRARAVHAGPCPRCGGPGPVDVHTSYRVWSLVLITTSSSHPQVSCRSCAIKSMVGDAVFSAALGWWGIPWGVFLTPVQVGRNLFAMARRGDPTAPSPLLQTVVRTGIAEDLIATQGPPAEPVATNPGKLKQSCPICSADVAESLRYPRYVCGTCATRTQSADGRLLTFSNVGMSGGFVAHYRGTTEEYPSHECFIDGARCHADEARFGGIVIQPLE